ncbi:MAG: radical SAM protein [Theionarchaea archaeon]|nr:radical SAM protein [Theionarchaea archaeon]
MILEYDEIPHLCHIELTYQCNQNCIFCYNPNRTMKEDTEKIDRIVQSVADSQIPHVYLIGGEPSLLPVRKINEYIEMLSHSSVTIVTNGVKLLEGVSSDLACFGVPLHGADAETHEFHTTNPGSFETVLNTVEYYVDYGFDVRCIPVLTGYNYNQMYDIIGLAAELGMESIFVDRYEDGGIGATRSSVYSQLKPTLEQFRIALDQVIKAKKDFTVFEGRVGFGTAIPYCIDTRMIEEDVVSNCGVGTYFCAINPNGDVRICNQSEIIFGNVLAEPLEVIWNKESINVMFRNLEWVNEPCKSCGLLCECVCGCKVDVNESDKFCIDYAVRNNFEPPKNLSELYEKKINEKMVDLGSYPDAYRVFRVNRYTKLTKKYEEKFLVTRYQTVKLNDAALEIVECIIEKKMRRERDLIEEVKESVDEPDVRTFLTKLLHVGALDFLGAENASNHSR